MAMASPPVFPNSHYKLATDRIKHSSITFLLLDARHQGCNALYLAAGAGHLEMLPPAIYVVRRSSKQDNMMVTHGLGS